MQLSLSRLVLMGLTLIDTVRAVSFTDNQYKDIAAGKTFEVTWEGNGTPVDLQLLKGSNNKNLVMAVEIAGAAHGPSFFWSCPKDLAPGDYAFKVMQGGVSNYSPIFHIDGVAPSHVPPPPPSAPLTPPVASAKPPAQAPTKAAPAAKHPPQPRSLKDVRQD